jgi:hypothetical protein
MAVTCRDIITRSLRKARIYAAGEEPSADDMADGLDELQNLYEQWGANGMFGRLADVYTNSDYEAAPNERVTVTSSAVVTIPVTVSDDGSDYPPYDMAFVEVIDTVAGTVSRYLYSGGAWVSISDLSLDDEAPLAGRGRGGLSACLAIAFAEEFGTEVGQGVQRQAGSFRTGLSLKMGGDANRTAPDYF